MEIIYCESGSDVVCIQKIKDDVFLKLSFIDKKLSDRERPLYMFDVEGILAPVFTPMDSTGSINLQVIPEYMAYLNKHRINGILVGGTTGEAMSLSVKERKTLLEAWIKAARPLGTKVIAQVGGAPLPDVIELAKHADQLELDAIMTLPELYYKPKTVELLVMYLETIAKAAPTRPVIYYHFPMMTGVDVNMRELFSLASSRIPTFKGAKADLGVMEQVSEQLANDQRIFIANHHLGAAVFRGNESSIATVSNMFPDLVHSIVDAVKSTDVIQANFAQNKLNKLVDIVASQGDFVPSMKTAMELVTNIPVGPARLPLIALDQKQRTLLKESLSTVDHLVVQNHC